MNILGALQGAITFVLIIGVLVFFHELGHFLFAKLFKMKVDEFAIGMFNPKIRIWHDGETEYNLRAIPIGGFVRIRGMEADDTVERKLAGEDASSIESEDSADVPRVVDKDGFNTRPIYQRFWVILGGPLFSLVFGWLVLCLIGSIYGVPTKALLAIGDVVKGSVAATAGIKPGEIIVAVDGKPMDSFDATLDSIKQSAGKPLRLSLRQDNLEGAAREVVVTPKADQQPGEDKPVGRIGIQPVEFPTEVKRLSLPDSFELGTTRVGLWFEAVKSRVVSGAIKDDVGGPVAIFTIAKKSAEVGGAMPALVLGQLSLSLGLFNLLPIPVLDGGHLMLMTIEAIRRRKLTVEQSTWVQYAGAGLLLLVFVTVMFKDITKLLFKG